MAAKTNTNTNTNTNPASAGAVQKPVVAKPSCSQIGVANSNLDGQQVLKAFRALCAHIARRGGSKVSTNHLALDGRAGDLRDAANAVYVQITVNTLSPTSHVKPVRINLPHALHTPGEVSTCLLVKDPQRQYKHLLVQHNIRCISRVVGVTKLKGKFRPYDARRALVQHHHIFLADARIVPTLPNVCGKVFFDARKNPITVDITKNAEALATELESAIKATTFLQNKGSCSTVKVGYVSVHSPEQLTENVMAALPAVLSRLKGGWENVHNIEVKTGNSAALPIWNAKLGVKTHVTPTAEPVVAENEVKSAKESAKKSGKRAAAAEEEEEEEVQVETPSKKKAATPKKPSARKTRAAAAKAKAGNAIEDAAATTPVKSASATPRKMASSVTRNARKAK